MPEQSSEIVIVGGGVIGSALAYHLALDGRAPLVIDRAAPATAPAASWASAGGVRRQGRDPAEAALASAAIARWPSLAQELAADLYYRQGGQLLVAETEAEAERLAGFVAEQQAMGFGDVRLVAGAELREIAPALAPQVLAGSFSPADGQADPARTTRAFAAAAQRHGARYWEGVECQALLADGDRVVGVRTTRGDVAAGQVVLAAGAWSDLLAAPIGLELPVRPAAYQMLLSTSAPAGLLAPVVSALGQALSLKQLVDGAFLLGGGWPGDVAPDRRGYAMREASVAGGWAAACAIVPAVGEQRLADSWCGLEAECLDGVPLLGPAPGWRGLTLSLGFCGHGFAIAPAVGRALAEQLAGRPAPELSGLDPARMAGFDPAAVAAFRLRRQGT
jgi:sarcosine oxidase subunit beta